MGIYNNHDDIHDMLNENFDLSISENLVDEETYLQKDGPFVDHTYKSNMYISYTNSILLSELDL